VQRLTKTSSTGIIQQLDRFFWCFRLLVRGFSVSVVVVRIVIDPVDADKVQPGPNLLGQVRERLFVFGIVRGCLVAERTKALLATTVTRGDCRFLTHLKNSLFRWDAMVTAG
jgi:hypothetical protein